MSKNIRKFRKDFYDDYDDDQYENQKTKVDKRKVRRMERALKTKNIDYLVSEETIEDRFVANLQFHK
jgi:hypothetical protein